MNIDGTQAQYILSRDDDGVVYITDKLDSNIVFTAALEEEITFTDGSLMVYEYVDDPELPAVTAIDILSGVGNVSWVGGNIEIYGLDGNDTFQGGAGQDYFDGGPGDDTVIASGNQADYEFGVTGQGNNLFMTGVPTDGPDNFDVYRDIDKIQFADGVITVHEATAKLENEYSVFSEPADITTLANGAQVIVWKQGDGIVVQLASGEEVASPVLLPDTGAAGQPVVTALANGGYAISWSVNADVGNSTFYTQVFSENGATTAPVASVVPNAGVWDFSTVGLANGTYAVAWTHEPNGENEQDHAFVQLFNADGTSIDEPIALTASISSYPAIAALNNGGFVAVWENEDAKGNIEIFQQRFLANGLKDGKAAQVNTVTTGDQGSVDVAVLADDSYVVTWTRDASENNIFMQRYSESGTKLGGETQVNTTNGFYGDSSITALTTGGYVVTWANSDDPETSTGSSIVYAQMFDKNGAKVGIELIVAKSTHHDFYPEVTATAEGGFAVVWESYNTNTTEDPDGNIAYKIFDALGNFRTLTGDDGNNTISWSGTPGVTLDGGLGDDVLNGGDASDTLIGGEGADLMSGGKGNDTYVVDDANDVVSELANQGTDTVRASVSYTLAGNVENLTLTGSDDINATGNALANVLTGNAGANELDGDAGADTLVGAEGDDTYVVDNLKDVILENEAEGTDVVKASVTWTLGANLEQLYLTGDAAINGTGNALDNTLVGNIAKNTLTAGDGNDVLDGGMGADTLVGGKGSDNYVVDLVLKGTGAKAVVALEDKITEAANVGDTDVVTLRGDFLTVATTTLTLGANLETLDASLTGATKLNLTGNALANTLIGNSADNVLNGGAGIDTLMGGLGDDTYVIDNAAELELIQEQSDEGTDTLRITYKGGVNADVAALVDLRSGSLGNIELLELAGIGVYSVVGNDLDNALNAGKTASVLNGGKGNDVYTVGHKDAQVAEDDNDGDDGIDTVQASVSFTLGDNIENLILTGKAALNGTGNSLDNEITGNDGANMLDGGAGGDTLSGGRGNDTYIVDDLGDVVVESAGEGTDTIKASITFDLNDTLSVENLTLTGTDDVNATGNAGANTLTGNGGANILDGGEGVDKLLGGGGDDTYIVDLLAKGSGSKVTVALQDTVTEKKDEGSADTLVLRVSQEVIDKQLTSKATTLTLANYLENVDASQTGALKLNLTGNAANNVITGNDGDNVLTGGAGNDTLNGGDGNDVIIGGLGSDSLTGGTGADIFRFTSLKELGLAENQDVIEDFATGEDVINFKGFKGWTFDATATGATGAKQVWAETTLDGDTILHGNSGGTDADEFTIKLVGVNSLADGDITFV